jgi:putative oxidoreductase
MAVPPQSVVRSCKSGVSTEDCVANAELGVAISGGCDKLLLLDWGRPMIDQRTAPYAAFLLRITIAGLFIAALYGKCILKPISLWWNGLLKAGYPEWVLAYTLSAEFASAVLLLLGIYTRWVSLYTLPMMIGATHFWMVRKSFWFVEGGWEMPFVWSIMLLTQALLGDGAFAIKVPSLPWERRLQKAPA